MIKKFQRILSGVLAAMFVGQVMIYGDGSSQGIAHAETISEIKESLQLSENADALQQEYENSIDGLGEVDYFGNPEEISLYSSDTGDVSVAEAGGLAISGYVGQYGTYSDLTKVKILIFDGWDLANQTTANASGFFTISTYGLGPDTNVKLNATVIYLVSIREWDTEAIGSAVPKSPKCCYRAIPHGMKNRTISGVMNR